MTTVRRVANSTVIPFIFYGIAVLALFVGYVNQSQISKESQARTAVVEVQNAAIEEQNTRIRIAFCGVAESIAGGPSPTTAAGANIKAAFTQAANSGGVGCTPDPLDGR